MNSEKRAAGAFSMVPSKHCENSRLTASRSHPPA